MKHLYLRVLMLLITGVLASTFCDAAGPTVIKTTTSQSIGGGFTNNGLDGSYFNNPEFKGEPSFLRRDVRINFDWGALLPVGGSSAEPYKSFPRDNFDRVHAEPRERYTPSFKNKQNKYSYRIGHRCGELLCNIEGIRRARNIHRISIAPIEHVVDRFWRNSFLQREGECLAEDRRRAHCDRGIYLAEIGIRFLL